MDVRQEEIRAKRKFLPLAVFFLMADLLVNGKSLSRVQ